MRELASSPEPTHLVAGRLAEVRQGNTRLGDIRDAGSLRFSARCLKDVDPDVFTPLLASQWLDGFDIERIFAQVRCPALVLRGDPHLGGMLHRDQAEALTHRLAEGLLVDIGNAGHLLHATATEAVLRVVLPFLESL
jgi:pimeloyl-ACP methyl ester carboxylesterase